MHQKSESREGDQQSQRRGRWENIRRHRAFIAAYTFLLPGIFLLALTIFKSWDQGQGLLSTQPISALGQRPTAAGLIAAVENTPAPAQPEAILAKAPAAESAPPASAAPVEAAAPAVTPSAPQEASAPAEEQARAEEPAEQAPEDELRGAAQLMVEEPVAQVNSVTFLIDDWRFTSEQGLTTDVVQSLLDGFPGPLKSTVVPAGPGAYSFAEMLVGQSTLYGINPKVVLAILELKEGLLTNPAADPATAAGSMRWVIHEMHQAQRLYPGATTLAFADGVTAALPEGTNAGSYAVLFVLAKSSTPEALPALLGSGPGTFVGTYTTLFGDPRESIGQLPHRAEPFMVYPKETRSEVTSFFDHEYPFLKQNGSLVSYLGQRDVRISYDGHTGWDYGGAMGGQILATAAGKVLFAGWSDDGCLSPAGAVVIDHGNGYRSLYWHLRDVVVQTGQQIEQGQRLGLVGATGCAAGPHLHFQVSYAGRLMDPYGWCGEPGQDPWANHPFGIESHWLWADRPSPCELPGNATVVAAGGEGFSVEGNWVTEHGGVRGGSVWAASYQEPAPVEAPAEAPAIEGGMLGTAPEGPSLEATLAAQKGATATWRPSLPAAGRYRVLAFTPYLYNGLAESRSVRYTVTFAGGSQDLEVDQKLLVNEWADLGTYTFDPAAGPAVSLSNKTGYAREGVWAGMVIWVPAD